jgi:hypothetical protein
MARVWTTMLRTGRSGTSASMAKLAWQVPLPLARSRAYREPGQLGVDVGFFSRLLVPRSVRRAVHPGRAVKRAITPKPIKKARRALHPVDNAVYSMQRSVATSIRSGGKGKTRVWRHGNCPVNHRSPEAAARCRNR